MIVGCTTVRASATGDGDRVFGPLVTVGSTTARDKATGAGETVRAPNVMVGATGVSASGIGAGNSGGDPLTAPSSIESRSRLRFFATLSVTELCATRLKVLAPPLERLGMARAVAGFLSVAEYEPATNCLSAASGGVAPPDSSTKSFIFAPPASAS